MEPIEAEVGEAKPIPARDVWQVWYWVEEWECIDPEGYPTESAAKVARDGHAGSGHPACIVHFTLPAIEA